MLLLDTNVVSELRKVVSGRAHPSVIAWNVTVDPAQTFISVIVLHELEIGVRGVERVDAVAGRALRHWLDETVRTAFYGRILPVDEAVALKAAEWHVPDPKPINDAFIAATASLHRMTLATRNTRDFIGMEVDLVNPWDVIP